MKHTIKRIGCLILYLIIYNKYNMTNEELENILKNWGLEPTEDNFNFLYWWLEVKGEEKLEDGLQELKNQNIGSGG